MISSVRAGAVEGISSYLMMVETDLSEGLPFFSMVGFLSGEVKEAGERVRVAIKNTGVPIPPGRITINFSPANIPKRGVVLDLPVAVGILICLGVIPQEAVRDMIFLGELGLTGEIRPVKGVLPIVRKAVSQGTYICILPEENCNEGAVIEGSRVIGMKNLAQLIQFFRIPEEERKLQFPFRMSLPERAGEQEKKRVTDFADIRGQTTAKRGLEIAAAGFHNILMSGPPGSGKSMLASALPGILPPLSTEETMEVSDIYSVSGMLKDNQPLIETRPFVAPHHSATIASISGGGSIPRPGMVSLAHRGILFLDEMPEFKREVLDCLRQPMEDHEIRITRNLASYTYPSRFLLVGAMNPCPCGYYPDLNKCHCTFPMIRRYQQKISGPVLDRIDLYVTVSRTPIESLFKNEHDTSSEEIRKRVMQAVEIQKERFKGTPIVFNADMNIREIEKYCFLGRNERDFMKEVYEKMQLSVRGCHRILRVARTIADLGGTSEITENELMEAVGFRNMEGGIGRDEDTRSGHR